MDQRRRCPQCGNPLFEDKQKSLTQCKNKNCGIIIERELITYDQEVGLDCVNLHENDDQSKKITRFGGYENKTEAFKNKLSEKIMQKSNDKDRKALSKKFEEGETMIVKLSRKFRMNEQFTASAQAKYRELLFQKIEELDKHKFTAVGVISFELAVEEAKRRDPENRKLNKLTIELISSYANVTMDKIKKMSDTLMLRTSRDQYSKEDHYQTLINKSKEFDFNEEEKTIFRPFLFNLLDSPLLKGEKSPTINAVILYCVAQLSENPELNIIGIDKFAAVNDVTKDTVKKLWNQVVSGLITQQIVPAWTSRKPLTDLRTMN